MKVSREQMAANRERILQVAAQLFRERGFDDVSVAEVMQNAGLTHGGFYGHFASKEALAAEAAAYALNQTRQRWNNALSEGTPTALESMVELYLSPAHRDHPGSGCMVAALGTDAARQSATVKSAFSKEVAGLIATLAGFVPGKTAEERNRRAAVMLAQLVGTIVLSRALGREPLADELLAASRDAMLQGQ